MTTDERLMSKEDLVRFWAARGQDPPRARVRCSCEGMVDGHLVRISVECAPELERRAYLWAIRQRKANKWGGHVSVEGVVGFGDEERW